MIIRKKFFGLIFIFLLSSGILYAEYAWPVLEKNIISVSSKYYKDRYYTTIETNGEILAVSNGVVSLVRFEDSFFNLPGLVEIETEQGIEIAYFDIIPQVSIGDIVSVGQAIGTVGESQVFDLSAYDLFLQTFFDPLYILPDINRTVVILLEDITFIYANQTINGITRRAQGGLADLLVRFSIKDKNSSGYLLPYLVITEIGDEEIIITRDAILKSDATHSIKDNGQFEIMLEDVFLPYGYTDISFIVNSPLQGKRTMRFNIFFTRETDG